jgi:hypothetical protein
MATLALPLAPVRTGRSWTALALAIAAVAMAWQVRLGVDSDISWLLTVGEGLLDGKRLYVDLLETNPPASVLIYLPGILLARAVGVSSEAGTMAAVLALAAAAWAIAERVARHGGCPAALLPPARAAGAGVLLLAPAACFAQREHVALLAMLPLLAVAVVRAKGGAVVRADALLAGLGAGVAVALKPHFVLAVAPVILWAAWRARRWRGLVAPEIWAAGALLVGYAAVVLVWFRPFLTDRMPVLAAAYLPMRIPVAHLIAQVPVLVSASAAAVALRLGGRRDAVAVPLLAAAGFLAAAAIQGKGYLNHYLPVVALALLALAAATLAAPARDNRRLGAAALVLFTLAAARCFAALAGLPGLEEAARRVAPPHPRVVLAGPNPDVGHPLVRQLGGRWVQRPHSLWVMEAAAERLAPGAPALAAPERARLARLAADDAAMFAADVRRGRPDLVLVDGDGFAAWIAATPVVAQALRPYREAARVGDVRLWVRWKS